MPSVKDSSALRRLNAPTRSAAIRRRRLRKALSAAFAASAVLIALAPGASRSVPPGHAATSQLTGRHILSLPADPALVAALSPTSTVDVWDRRGRRLASKAPVMPAPAASGLSVSNADRSHVLAGLRSTEMQQVIGTGAADGRTEKDIVLTIAG